MTPTQPPAAEGVSARTSDKELINQFADTCGRLWLDLTTAKYREQRSMYEAYRAELLRRLNAAPPAHGGGGGER